TLHDVNLFPVVVYEGLGGERAGLDLQEPRTAAALFRFVEIRCEDLLVAAGRVAGRPLPARRQVDFHEFKMRFGFHGFPEAKSGAARRLARCSKREFAKTGELDP